MEANGHGLIMLMGKGGGWKNHSAAAIAVALAARGHAVHLTTSDPAAHLEDTLSESLALLTVSRIDPLAESDRYRQEVMNTKGKAGCSRTRPAGRRLALPLHRRDCSISSVFTPYEKLEENLS
jgi:CO dehydrogenase nickel-insertion accessory protein CooC1